jgi:hypothetical protein
MAPPAYAGSNVIERSTPGWTPGYSLADLGKTVVGDVMGYGNTKLGPVTIPGSPLRGFAQTTGLGIGAGYLGSKLYNWFKDDGDEEKARRTKNWMLMGGLGSGIPAGAFSLAGAIPAVKDYGIGGLVNFPGTQTEKPAAAAVMSGMVAIPKPKAFPMLPTTRRFKPKATVSTKPAGGSPAEFAKSACEQAMVLLQPMTIKIAQERVMQKQAWGFGDQDMFPVGHSMELIATDPVMTPVDKALAMNVILTASNNQPRGLIGLGDLVRGAVGAGLGYAAGTMVAKAMDGLLGLPDPIQKVLHATGAIGGALMAAGLKA